MMPLWVPMLNPGQTARAEDQGSRSRSGPGSSGDGLPHEIALGTGLPDDGRVVHGGQGERDLLLAGRGVEVPGATGWPQSTPLVLT